jgi:hypothetical protein
MSKKLPHSGVVFSALKPPGIGFAMDAVWNRKADATGYLSELAELLATVPPKR